MAALVEAEVRNQIDQRLTARGWVLDPEHPNRDVFIERSVIKQLSTIQSRKLGDLSPDYVFCVNGVPVAILEAKKPNTAIEQAFKQAKDYAKRINVDFVFACNGPTFRSLHIPTGKPLYVNNFEVNEPLSPIQLREFWRQRSNKVMTIPHDIIRSRQSLINIFENLNNVLRNAGIRAGLERFTEFANLLFLKLLSERDLEDHIWHDLLNKPEEDLPDYLNGFVVDRLKDRYKSDVLSHTKVNGAALKRIIKELTPLHLSSVDEDLKGVAFEHFLSRTTTANNNDLGEYFTPRPVVRFMVQLVNPQFGKTVYDPFCGTGGFLIETFRHLSQQLRPTEDATKFLHHKSIYGREITTTARVAKMNMILFGDGHSGVSQGDSLTPFAAGVLRDNVLSNIPFSLHVELDVLRAVDASAKDADEACLLHCFNSINRGGSMAVVLPEGLVVNKKHLDMWKRLFKESRIRAIATLPRGTFTPYTDAGTKVLYLTDKGTRSTTWYYEVTIGGSDKVKGESIEKDEFLFFYQHSEDPAEKLPPGVKVAYVDKKQGRLENNLNVNIDSLGNVALIKNGKMITQAQTKPGFIPVIGGGRVPSCTHNTANTEGQCFTVSKSGAYSGYVWWHEDPVWASDCMVIKSLDERKYMTFYLYLCMKAKQEELHSLQQGTGQPHVYRHHIIDFPIPKLSLEKQFIMVNEAKNAICKRIDAERQESKSLEETLGAINALYENENQ